MERTPPDPTDIDAAVLGAYGATMLTVQTFERSLAVLVLAQETQPWKNRTFKTDEQCKAYVGKQISRAIDVFQRSSAKALRNRLPDSFDLKLKDQITALIVWRDRLAHRYLVEHARLGGPPHFDPCCSWSCGNSASHSRR